MKVNVFWQNLLNLIVLVSVALFLTACGGSTNSKYKDTSELEQPPQVVTFNNKSDESGDSESKTDAKKGLGDSVHAPDGTSLIFDKPFDVAWPVIAVALEMSGMEISDRNREKGQYYVVFDPDDAENKSKSSDNLFSTLFSSNKYAKGRYVLTFYENPRSVKIEAKFLEAVEDDVSSQDGYAETTATDNGVEKLLNKLYLTLHDDFSLN